MVGVLHLIALKLHALARPHRQTLGRDYLEILNLIRANRVDINAAPFEEIMNRYGSETLRARIQRDLTEPL